MPDDDCNEHIITKIELLNTTLITIEINLKNLMFTNNRVIFENVRIKEEIAQLKHQLTDLKNKFIVNKYL